MTRTDRRQTARYDMEIPLTIRTMEKEDMPTHVALSSNVSASGLYLATDLLLQVGAPVEIAMRMPAQVTGKPSRDWLCRGRVVRVEGENQWTEKHRVGVVFQYYEVIEVAEEFSRN